MVTTLLAAGVIASVFVPPLLPEWRAAHSVARLPTLLTTRQARERLAAKRRLFAALGRRREPAAVRPASLPLARPATRPARPAARDSTEPLTAGFYVNWDDNSYASFAAHAAELDWVICEWSFVAAGGDSLRFALDRRIPYVIQRLAPADRPLIFAMVSNFDSATKRFESRDLRRLIATPDSRARAITQLDLFVRRYGLSGVTLDFESLPVDLNDEVLEFVRGLRAALNEHGALVTQALGTDVSDTWLRRYGDANDDVFLMLYDEHYGGGDVGPVASQEWYAERVRHAMRLLDPARTILAIGAYGYDWNDAGPDASGSEMTFQDVMAAAREHQSRVVFDPVALNPYITWTDPDSTDHVAWYLDAATAYNQALVGDAAGRRRPRGLAPWLRGSRALARDRPRRPHAAGHGTRDDPRRLRRRVRRRRRDPPSRGPADRWRARRAGGLDERPRARRAGQVVPFALGGPARRPKRAPRGAHLRRRSRRHLDADHPRHAPRLPRAGAPSSSSARTSSGTSRSCGGWWPRGTSSGTTPSRIRTWRSTSPFVTRLQLDATERLLEAVTGRRSAFFRPPYFGDAEPTDSTELIPVSIASDLGYVTAGLHIDSEDWEEPGVQTIVDTVLAQRRAVTSDRSGNVILLHDSGGDRSQTVAALGPLIDSLRAMGDTLVPLSELAGISREEAMAPLPVRSAIDAGPRVRHLRRGRRDRVAAPLDLPPRRGARRGPADRGAGDGRAPAEHPPARARSGLCAGGERSGAGVQ